MDAQTRKVCVVDDDPNIVRLIKTRLENVGFEVTAAYDGKEALLLICRESPDLVISDVMMPEMDGPTLVAALKENPRTENIPIIFLTSLVEREKSDRAFLSGYRLVAKPFDPKELYSAVHDALPFQ